MIRRLYELPVDLALTTATTAVRVIAGRRIIAPKEVQEERERRCRPCGWFRKDDTRCMKCGCWLRMKWRLAGVACPEGLWGPWDS